jgi:hypothetical protein
VGEDVRYVEGKRKPREHRRRTLHLYASCSWCRVSATGRRKQQKKEVKKEKKTPTDIPAPPKPRRSATPRRRYITQLRTELAGWNIECWKTYRSCVRYWVKYNRAASPLNLHGAEIDVVPQPRCHCLVASLRPARRPLQLDVSCLRRVRIIIPHSLISHSTNQCRLGYRHDLESKPIPTVTLHK